MHAFLLSLLLGYLLGIVNPAALIAYIKKVDLRKSGTKNLGATNVSLSIGKKWGVFVMFFDIGKAYLAVKLAAFLFPDLAIAGLVAGSGAVVGHVFPVQLKFKGGKGSATFGGMILALDPMLFVTLLVFGIIVVLITGYTFLIPVSASAVAPLCVGLYTKSLAAAVILLLISALMHLKHIENFKRIPQGTEATLRDVINKHKK